jgi:hypothetical protein
VPLKEQTRTHQELDSTVVNIELTLASIIQGVALYFLTENSRAVIINRQYLFWPYVAAGLIVILLFWSRSLIHTLTVIRWPLEFAHNFLYIASTLVEAVIFTQLVSPVHWYALSAVYGCAIWLLFGVDLRMIRRRLEERNGDAAHALLLVVEREQLLNVRVLMPQSVLFSLAIAVTINTWPEIFIDRGWHVVFALFQLIFAAGYLFYVIRFYKRLLPLVVAAQYEWNGEEMPVEETMK